MYTGLTVFLKYCCFAYRVIRPYFWPIEDALVPNDPTEVIERKRQKEILVHLDPTAFQVSGKRKKCKKYNDV